MIRFDLVEIIVLDFFTLELSFKFYNYNCRFYYCLNITKF